MGEETHTMNLTDQFGIKSLEDLNTPNEFTRNYHEGIAYHVSDCNDLHAADTGYLPQNYVNLENI